MAYRGEADTVIWRVWVGANPPDDCRVPYVEPYERFLFLQPWIVFGKIISMVRDNSDPGANCVSFPLSVLIGGIFLCGAEAFFRTAAGWGQPQSEKRESPSSKALL